MKNIEDNINYRRTDLLLRLLRVDNKDPSFHAWINRYAAVVRMLQEE